jgi:hypothetical protein
MRLCHPQGEPPGNGEPGAERLRRPPVASPGAGLSTPGPRSWRPCPTPIAWSSGLAGAGKTRTLALTRKALGRGSLLPDWRVLTDKAIIDAENRVTDRLD